MATAFGAGRASDAHVAAELGALVHTRGLIEDPRWRLDAVLALVPALHRFGASLDGVKAEVRAGIRGAPCPTVLYPCLRELVEISLAGGEVPSGAVAALWNRSLAGAAHVALTCAMGAGAFSLARRIVAAVPEHRAWLAPALATGVLGGRFVAKCADPSAEFPATPDLLVALVDDVARTGDHRRAADAERVAAALPATQRWLAIAQLARADLCLHGGTAGLARLRTIRARGVRAGAGLLLTGTALARGELEAARAIADTTESDLFRQRALLAIAHHLVDAGDSTRALRLLGRVHHGAVLGERMVLRDQIVLSARRMHARMYWVDRRVLGAARPAPAWTTHGAERVDPARRTRLLYGAFHLLIYLTHRRDEVFANAAAMSVRAALGDAGLRRTLLAMLRALELEPRDVVMALRGRVQPSVTSALWAEHLGERAEALLRWRPAVTPTCTPELARTLPADSLERALHDESVARSPNGPRKRRVLVAAAKYCLRAAFDRPVDTSMPMVDARLRALLYVGGDLARDAIAGALTTAASGAVSPPLFARVNDALCVLDAALAARLAIAGAPALAAAGVDVDRALAVAEVHGGLVHGFSRAWSAARRRLPGVDGLRWLAELVTRRADADAIVTPPVLDWIARQDTLPATPGALLEALACTTDTLETLPLDRVAGHVATDRDLLERLLVVRPPRVDPRMSPWSTQKWRELLERAAAMPVVNSAAIIDRASRAVPAADRFRYGDVGRAGVIVDTRFVVAGEPFRLHLLDKRRDLLTYLRFPDVPYDCCYRSDSSYYTDPEYDTRDEVLAVWRDPLAFCFRVDRGPTERPCGFVFGGFAGIEDTPVVVLNGLYVRPNRAAVRDAVLRGIETMLCARLGIDRVAVAVEHGGEGPIPPRYVEQSAVRLTRWRGLATRGAPVRECYDDISCTVNIPIVVGHMRWASGLLTGSAGGIDA